MKDKLHWIIPLMLLILSLSFVFRPAGKISLDKSVSQNRILIQYENFGCGCEVVKVLDGGKQLASEYVGEYPDIGTNEVVFSNGSDEPKMHINPVTFQLDGIGEKYTYIIEGTSVGVTNGVYDDCSQEYAYNENVVEFKVDKWYFTSYVPYIVTGNILVIIVAFLIAFFSLIPLVLIIVFAIIDYVKNKFIK